MSEYGRKLLEITEAWHKVVVQMPRKDWKSQIDAAEAEIAKVHGRMIARHVKWALDERLLRNRGPMRGG